MRFTAGQIRRLTEGAVRTGRIPPWRAAHYAARIRAGGPAGAKAVATLLALAPARHDVRASWAADPRARAVAAKKAEPSEEDIWQAVYPDDEHAAAATEALVAEQVRRRPALRSYDNEMRMPEAAASKGIEAKRAARARAGDPAASADLDQMFEALFGREPGQGKPTT